MGSYYIHLPSNVKDIYNRNTISNYITKLSRTLYLDGDWEIALSGIIFTKSWFNVHNNQLVQIIDDGRTVFRMDDAVIKAGHYADASNLVELINQHSEMIVSNMVKFPLMKTMTPKAPEINPSAPRLIYDQKENRVVQILGKYDPKLNNHLRIVLTEEIRNILGPCNTIEEFNSEFLNNETVVDLSGIIYSLYVYCDIVKSSFVGDTQSQILRIVKVPKVEHGEVVEVNFDHPIYLPINCNEISSIEIDIKDDTGETLKIRSGRVVTILH